MPSARPLRLRKILSWTHLWAGIVLAIYLTLMGITGALLVFEDEFFALSLPHSSATASSAWAAPAQVLANAQKAVPNGHISFVILPTLQQPVYRLWVEEKKQSRIFTADAVTGHILAPGSRPWIDWVHDLHTELLLGPGGVLCNGIGAIGLMLLILTGIWLWWPGFARLGRALTLRLHGNLRSFNFSLHNVVGSWALFFLFWWSFSGIYFAWPAQVARLIGHFSQPVGMQAPTPLPDVPTPATAPTVEQILVSAQKATPGGILYGLSLPQFPDDNLIVYVDRKRSGDFSHRDILTFSSRSGKLLSTWHYGENHTPADWILWAMHPLHFGTLWGLGFKILWALVGLSLPTLSITGLFIYWNRRLRFLLYGSGKASANGLQAHPK